MTSKEYSLIGSTGITINGGELTLVSTNTVKDSTYYAMYSDSITIADGLEVQASTDPDGTLVDYVAADNNTYDRVEIKLPPEVYVGGVGMADGDYLANNATATRPDKPSVGYAYYQDGVLTLHNYNFSGTGYEIGNNAQTLIYASRNLKIVLEGENTLTQTTENNLGIYFAEGGTISGSGSLAISGPCTYGIHVETGDFTCYADYVSVLDCAHGVNVKTGDIWISGGLLDVTVQRNAVAARQGSVTVTDGELTAKSTNGSSANRAINAANGFSVANHLTVLAAEAYDGVPGAYDAANIKNYDLIMVKNYPILLGVKTIDGSVGESEEGGYIYFEDCEGVYNKTCSEETTWTATKLYTENGQLNSMPVVGETYYFDITIQGEGINFSGVSAMNCDVKLPFYDVAFEKFTYTDTSATITFSATRRQTYDVFFYFRGDEYPISGRTIEAGQLVTKPDDPGKDGMHFLGWYTEDGELYDFDAPVTKNINLYAAFGHYVMFYWGESPVASQDIEDGKTATEIEGPTQEGYVFKGWYTEDDQPYDFSTPVKADLNLYAKFAKIHTVTFYLGESPTATQDIEDGKTATQPEDPDETGEKFLGWYTEDDEPYDFSTPVTGDLSLHAKFVKSHTVTLMFGDSAVGWLTAEDGKPVAKPEDPGQEGKIFAGWYTEDGMPYDFTKPVTQDINLIATFTEVAVDGVPLVDGWYLPGGSTTPTKTKPSGGYAYYKDGALTLSGYTNTGAGYTYTTDNSAAIYSTTDINIVLADGTTNKISISGASGVYRGIAAEGDLKITGNGAIQITAPNGAIVADSIDATCGAFTANGYISANTIDMEANGDVIVTNGYITCTAGTSTIVSKTGSVKLSSPTNTLNSNGVMDITAADTIEIKSTNTSGTTMIAGSGSLNLTAPNGITLDTTSGYAMSLSGDFAANVEDGAFAVQGRMNAGTANIKAKGDVTVTEGYLYTNSSTGSNSVISETGSVKLSSPTNTLNANGVMDIVAANIIEIKSTNTSGTTMITGGSLNLTAPNGITLDTTSGYGMSLSGDFTATTSKGSFSIKGMNSTNTLNIEAYGDVTVDGPNGYWYAGSSTGTSRIESKTGSVKVNGTTYAMRVNGTMDIVAANIIEIKSTNTSGTTMIAGGSLNLTAPNGITLDTTSGYGMSLSGDFTATTSKGSFSTKGMNSANTLNIEAYGDVTVDGPNGYWYAGSSTGTSRIESKTGSVKVNGTTYAMRVNGTMDIVAANIIEIKSTNTSGTTMIAGGSLNLTAPNGITLDTTSGYGMSLSGDFTATTSKGSFSTKGMNSANTLNIEAYGDVTVDGPNGYWYAGSSTGTNRIESKTGSVKVNGTTYALNVSGTMDIVAADSIELKSIGPMITGSGNVNLTAPNSIVLNSTSGYALNANVMITGDEVLLIGAPVGASDTIISYQQIDGKAYAVYAGDSEDALTVIDHEAAGEQYQGFGDTKVMKFAQADYVETKAVTSLELEVGGYVLAADATSVTLQSNSTGAAVRPGGYGRGYTILSDDAGQPGDAVMEGVLMGGRNYWLTATIIEKDGYSLKNITAEDITWKGYENREKRVSYDQDVEALYVYVALPYLDCTEHTYDAGVVTTEATCVKDGVMLFTCGTCGDTYTKKIPALGHDYDEGVVDSKPDCTNYGTKVFTCRSCGDTHAETIPALGHDYTGYVTKVATCIEDGTKTYICSRHCGSSYTEPIPATGVHSYYGFGVVTKEATCTEDGYTTISCYYCDDTYTEPIAKLGHSYSSYQYNNDATCTVDGTATAKCGRCNVTDTRTVEGSATGHEWVDATCIAPKTCGKCGITEGEKLEHTWVDATCNAPKTCGKCGIIEGEKLEHTWDEGEIVHPATVDKEGEKRYTCLVCGSIRTETIPKLVLLSKAISYDGNGALSGEHETEYILETYTYTLPECNFTPQPGQIFRCWRVKGVDMQPGESFVVETDTVITAIWRDMTVFVGGVEMDDGYYLATGSSTPTTTKPSGGYAFYDDGKLVLNNYTYTGFGVQFSGIHHAVIFSAKTLDIELIGTNTLTLNQDDDHLPIGIVLRDDNSSMEIRGEGALSITGGGTAIEARKGGIITVHSGTITTDCDGTGIKSDLTDFVMNGGNVTLVSKQATGMMAGSITVNGGTLDVTGAPYGQGIASQNGDITINGGKVIVRCNDGDGNDDENYALRVASSGKLVIADKMNVQASTQYDGTLGDFVEADYKTYDRVVIEEAIIRTVTFMVDSTVYKTEEVKDKTLVAQPADPELDGWKFLGWYTEDDEPFNFNLYIEKDTVVYAKFEAVPIANASVSGTVTSFNSNTDTVTIQLIEEGHTEVAYEVTTTGNSATYSITDVVAGTYTMKVSKNNHVTREYTVTVGSTAVTQNAKIHLLGDVNGDGKVTTIDFGRANAHAKGTSTLTGYELLCADTVKQDGLVTTADAARINAHARGTSTLW